MRRLKVESGKLKTGIYVLARREAVSAGVGFLLLIFAEPALRPMAHSSEAIPGFKSETVRGIPGFFRVGQAVDGKWWIIAPDGQRTFLRAVNGVHGVEDSPHEPAARLRAWGFNALGLNAEEFLGEEGLPVMGTVGFAETGAMIHAPGARLPDVFDPEWPRQAAARAGEICLPQAERRDLVGWIADDDVRWAQPCGGGRPSLLQICLSLEPAFAAYHAAWEFVLALHGGRLDAVAKAWMHPMANKEVVRALTRAEQGLATRGYWRDEARWSQEFARRYFAQTGAAIRTHDPNHLVFGCRFPVRATAAVLAECIYPSVDVAWIDLDDIPLASGGPVFAGDFSWVDARFYVEPTQRRAHRLTSVERMLRRGRSALERAARHPSVVGYAWSQWRDAPGEQPPFARGLVHVNDAEAREHTELLADLNGRMQELRGG